jgi:DNA-binding beta-propeller fold protein YncE
MTRGLFALAIANVLLVTWVPAAAGGQSATSGTSFSADLTTVPAEPVARQWTMIEVTVTGTLEGERVLVSEAKGVATINESGEAARAYPLTASEQDPIFRVEVVFPRPGTYSLTTEVTPAGRSAAIQTTFRVRVADQSLPPRDQPLLVVVSAGARQVSLLDPIENRTVASVAVPEAPACTFYEEHGQALWLVFAGSGSQESAPFAEVLDLGDLGVRERVPLPFLPAALVADAGRVFLADEQRNCVTWLERSHPGETVTVEVGPGPRALALLADGNLLCVANADLRDEDPYDSLSVIDLAKKEEIVRLPVGKHPLALLEVPGIHRLCVCAAGDNRVTIVDTQSWRLVSGVDSADWPMALAWAGGERARFLCRNHRSVGALDLTTNTVGALLALPATPDHLATDRRPGGSVYVACADANLVVSLPSSGKGEMKTHFAGERPVAVYYRQAAGDPAQRLHDGRERP